MIPHKTYIPHNHAFFLFSLFLQPKYTVVGSFSGHYFLPSSLPCIIIFQFLYHELKQNVFQYISNIMLIFIRLLQYGILQRFLNTCYLLEETEPMFVMHNISIATYDDIIHIDYDVNIYPLQ